MTADELESRLREWGRAYGEGRPKEWQEEATLTGSHPIAQAMQFAPGKAQREVAVAWQRRRRRDYWIDPMPCKETHQSSGHAVLLGGSSVRFTPQVEVVQSAVLALYRQDVVRGLVLQLQYCRRGSQSDKAAMMAAQGHRMKLRAYREALAFAKGWVGARLAA